MLVVLEALVYKLASLTGDELRFIRSYLNMTLTEFGKTFGVSHVAVMKWEKRKANISPSLELCIRLYVLDHLNAKDKEFRALYKQMNLEQLGKSAKSKIHPLHVDASTDEFKIAL